jgi:hypothetical protein
MAEESEVLVWMIGLGTAAGMLIGWFAGMAVGMARGKKQVIRRVRSLVSGGKTDFDVEPFLRGERKWGALGSGHR